MEHPAKLTDNCVAAIIARFLRTRGIKRIFALCGGHIMPIWMRVDLEGIQIIDVRDERAAVHMAQAHAEVTGSLGVALVTAGPGLTNSITGIANAHISRAPVLILSGMPPRPQEGRGALQDLDHCQLIRSITRYARTIREPSFVLRELDEAVSQALGHGSEPGPVYLDFPTDTLRAPVPAAVLLPEHFALKPRKQIPAPLQDIEAAIELLWSARRPLVVSGRGARGAGPELVALLDVLGAAYLDTGESRGLVPDSHPSVVAAARGAVMSEADVILTIGRRLDFQLAYGSPAIFHTAQFVRIADALSELRDNRRGAVEIFADPAHALSLIVKTAGNRPSLMDRSWAEVKREQHLYKTQQLRDLMADAANGADGGIHPLRLLHAVQERLDNHSIVVTDGGDFLAFTRIALSASTMLDPSSFGAWASAYLSA